MQHHHHPQVNGSYHFKREGELVHVFNSDGYLMAEYYSQTGRVSWQRVAPAPQRESVEKWLRENYPVMAVAARVPKVRAAKLKAKK